MGTRIRRIALLVVSAAVVAAGLVVFGRATVDSGAARDRGYRSGYQAGHDDGYFAALPVGEAQGRQNGRALQEGSELPANDRKPVEDAFTAGYVAGTNDVFAGYDGGWALSLPYLITVAEGSGQIAYRISSRVPVQAHVNYYLCPDGHQLCQQPRP